MKTKSEIVKLWTCPKCGRRFERQRQTHSCRPFPLKQHFEGKPGGRSLYEKFKQEVKKQIGAFKIESLECCIHFVSTFTFMAVKIFRQEIRVDFSLNRKIKSKRIKQLVRLSAHRFLFVVDITQEEEIDKELMEWIGEAHDKGIKETAARIPPVRS